MRHQGRFAELHDHRIALCLFFLIFITLANLRGVREAGSLFAAPSYAFIVSFLFLIGYGLVRYFINPGIAPVPVDADLKIAEGYEPHLLNWFLLLGAFANGCAALTGIEAISNGVQAFKQPEAKNAATTLGWMAFLLIVMFLGLSSGLPLALSGSTLLVWMREAGVDLGTIGLFALVGTPYTIKFLWAPFIDRYPLPLLGRCSKPHRQTPHASRSRPLPNRRRRLLAGYTARLSTGGMST